ncbi:MAG: hypothetical protein ACI9V1_000974 [Spirosomataceae bacterium]|jgi:hypothetical protein
MIILLYQKIKVLKVGLFLKNQKTYKPKLEKWVMRMNKQMLQLKTKQR